MSMLYHHQALAASVISQSIAVATSRKPDLALLRGVNMFLCSQVQEGAFTPWRSHINGAHSLLRLWGEAEFLGLDDFGYFLLMTTNIFGSATTPSCHLTKETIAQHDFYTSIIDSLGVDSGDSLTPVPTDLIKAVADINVLRAKRYQQRLEHSPGIDAFLSESRGIMESLKGFSATTWVQAAVVRKQHLLGSPKRDDFLDGWMQLVNAFQAAIVIYLVATTAENATSDDTEMHAYKIDAYCVAKTAIRSFFQHKRRGGTHFKFALWPMVVSGVEAIHMQDFQHVETLQQQLHEMSMDLGTLAMRDAAEFLGNLRQMQQANTEYVDWDVIFAKSPLFLM